MRGQEGLNKHWAGGYQDGIIFWDYLAEQLNSLVCGFGKWEGRRKSMFPGYLGIKRLMRKWRGPYAWNRTLFDVFLWVTKKNKVRKGFY